jgi:SAM-dependent methyltransferase
MTDPAEVTAITGGRRDETLRAAKSALADHNWPEARRLLAPLVVEAPHGVAAFHLARAELELGHPDVAQPLVTAFRAWRPQHRGARVLAARVHLALGELDEAEAEAQVALSLDPGRPGLTHLLQSIDKARQAATVAEWVRVIDANLADARGVQPTEQIREAALELRRMSPGPRWTTDRAQATIAFFHHAPDLDTALRNYDPHLIDVSTRFDYISWPRRIQEYVRGMSVLDVGCGFGGFGMGFLIAGTKAYTGLDPAMDLDSSRAKNKRTRRWEDMGVTPRQIADALPSIRLLQESSEDTSLNETFETITLHNVTEHLMRLDEVLADLTRLCSDETHIVFHHHNFYCWNGHHLAPNQPEQLDENSAEHLSLCDWRHIDLVPNLPADHYIRTNLNRVRLDGLHDSIARYFEIVRWDEIPSSPATLARLTPQILSRLHDTTPDLTVRDLSINAVFAVARVQR